MLTWRRPSWSGLKTSQISSLPDYHLGAKPEDITSPGMITRQAGEIASLSLEEGFLDVTYVKELNTVSKDKEKEFELLSTMKRYNLEANPISECCLALLFGANISDNRILFLLFPPKVFK